jgi:hypothetical protein
LKRSKHCKTEERKENKTEKQVGWTGLEKPIFFTLSLLPKISPNPTTQQKLFLVF